MTMNKWCFHTRARQRQDNDKTNVEPVHSYDAFHTRSDMSGFIGPTCLISCRGAGGGAEARVWRGGGGAPRIRSNSN